MWALTVSALCLGGVVVAAVADSGPIFAWGSNWGGGCFVPPPNAGFTDFSAGYDHGLALRLDGSLLAWGYNYYGQCDVPEPNEGFVAIDAGSDHVPGMKSLLVTGACCIGDGCMAVSENDCVAAGGTCTGDDTLCAAITCPDPCPEDLTGGGKVNIDDQFVILGSWGPRD